MSVSSQSTFTSQVNSSIGRRLFLKDDRADVHFIFDTTEDGRVKIPAHKFFLTESSDIFFKMFNGSWKENNEVEIDDASVDGFKEFLQFIYLDEVTLTVENVAEVMYLGNKYNVDECLTICSKFLKNTLDETNICWGYQLAITYEQENLKKFCETIIGLKSNDVLASDGFLRCGFDILSHISALESLSCSESELFEACMKRIETLGHENESAKEDAKCETRKLLNVFRLGSMTIKQWTKISLSFYDFFSFDEYREVTQLIGSEDFQATKLNSNRQKRVDVEPYNENDIIRCSRVATIYYSCKEFFIKDVEITTFSTNRTVLLDQFDCAEIYKGKARARFEENVPTEFTVFEMSSASSTNSNERVTLYSGKTEIKSHVTASITLDKPILIKASFKYEIHMKFEQSASEEYTLWRNLNPKVVIEPDFTVEFLNDVPDEEIVSRGLIKQLRFIKI